MIALILLMMSGGVSSLGSSGLMGHSPGSRQEVLNSDFCQIYHCTYVRTRQVGGLVRGISDNDDIYTVGTTQNPIGELGITHDGRTTNDTVGGLRFQIQAVPLKTTSKVIKQGREFFRMVLGSRLSVWARDKDIQQCLSFLIKDIHTTNPTGSASGLGPGRAQKALGCDAGPTKDKPGLYDIQFSADNY